MMDVSRPEAAECLECCSALATHTAKHSSRLSNDLRLLPSQRNERHPHIQLCASKTKRQTFAGNTQSPQPGHLLMAFIHLHEGCPRTHTANKPNDNCKVSLCHRSSCAPTQASSTHLLQDTFTAYLIPQAALSHVNRMEPIYTFYIPFLNPIYFCQCSRNTQLQRSLIFVQHGKQTK